MRSGFLDRVLRFSIPAGALAATATFITYEIGRRQFDISLSEARTLATATLLGAGLAVLIAASRPLRGWKIGLALAMAASYAIIVAIPSQREFFELDLFGGPAWIVSAISVAVASLGILAIPTMMGDDG